MSIADVGGDGEHPLDGFALPALHRGPTRDELEITRPHVPAFDDARFILRVDPKALPGVAASAAAIAAHGDNQAVLANKPRARAIVPAVSATIGLLLAALLRRRDRNAENEGDYRPLVRLPDGCKLSLVGLAVFGAGQLSRQFGRLLFDLLC